MIALLIESILGNADFPPFDDEFEEYLEGNEVGDVTVTGQYS